METTIIPIQNTDMTEFSNDAIERAGELLGCPLDRPSLIRALIIQRDTGLSLARGELSIINFGGKNCVFINKQGWLAYAARQPEYDGYTWGIEKHGDDWHAWCKVFRKDRTHQVYEDAWMSEDRQKSPAWDKLPKRMLVKVAIKRAHQAAFPVLNGLLTPSEVGLEEDTPTRITPQPGDITIEAEPAPQPQPKPERNQPKTPYTLKQAQDARQNMLDQGMTDAIFKPNTPGTAYIDGKIWDGDLIIADFNRQRESKKEAEEKQKAQTEKTSEPQPEKTEPAKKEQKPVAVQPTPQTVAPEQKEQPTTICPVCGNPSMTTDDLKSLTAAASALGIEPTFDPTICKECGKKWWAAVNPQESRPEPKKEEKIPPTEKQTAPKHTCDHCGKEMTTTEYTGNRLFSPPGKIYCKACLDKIETQYKTKTQPAEA
ncbi:MAG TPA: recombinase RecT [Methanocorpusculum sp.]|nr:recombinase RecT [Methanocorpusculum sp.]